MPREYDKEGVRDMVCPSLLAQCTTHVSRGAGLLRQGMPWAARTEEATLEAHDSPGKVTSGVPIHR